MVGEVKTAIVNVANGSWYPQGQKRLAESAKKHFPGADFFFYTNKYPANCPTHQEVPYAFKTYALREAILTGKYDVVMWMDASMWFVSDGSVLLDRLEQSDGVLVWSSVYCVSKWCSDAALKTLGITREVGKSIPLVLGGINMWDIRTQKAKDVFTMWHEYAVDGVTFPGAWRNDKGQVSSDPWVAGHRHDMPALSIACHRLDVQPLRPTDMFSQKPNEAPKDTVVVVARGM